MTMIIIRIAVSVARYLAERSIFNVETTTL